MIAARGPVRDIPFLLPYSNAARRTTATWNKLGAENAQSPVGVCQSHPSVNQPLAAMGPAFQTARGGADPVPSGNAL